MISTRRPALEGDLDKLRNKIYLSAGVSEDDLFHEWVSHRMVTPPPRFIYYDLIDRGVID